MKGWCLRCCCISAILVRCFSYFSIWFHQSSRCDCRPVFWLIGTNCLSLFPQIVQSSAGTPTCTRFKFVAAIFNDQPLFSLLWLCLSERQSNLFPDSILVVMPLVIADAFWCLLASLPQWLALSSSFAHRSVSRQSSRVNRESERVFAVSESVPVPLAFHSSSSLMLVSLFLIVAITTYAAIAYYLCCIFVW